MVIATEKLETEDQFYFDQVDQIWSQYDTDMDGKLNQQDALEFLQVVLKEQSNSEQGRKYLQQHLENFLSANSRNANDINKQEALEYIQGFRLGAELRQMVSNTEFEGATESTPLSTQ